MVIYYCSLFIPSHSDEEGKRSQASLFQSWGLGTEHNLFYQHGQKYIGCLIKLKDVKLNDMFYMFHSHWFVAEIKVVSLTHSVDVCSVAATIILLFCSRNLSFIIT